MPEVSEDSLKSSCYLHEDAVGMRAIQDLGSKMKKNVLKKKVENTVNDGVNKLMFNAAMVPPQKAKPGPILPESEEEEMKSPDIEGVE